jgi:thiol:disulfide interchange protein DsbC
MSNHEIPSRFLMLAAIMMLLPALSLAKGPDPAVAISQALEAALPNAKVQTVRQLAAVPGLFEVVTSSGIVYTDSKGELLLAGKLVDVRTKEDITARRWGEVQGIDFRSLPFSKAIKTVRGSGKREIAVFADPLCPFCQKLEQALAELTDVTIYTFLFPLEEVHPGARQKSVRLWCADQQALAWAEWMTESVMPRNGACDANPVAELLELGKQLKVSSTPTLFLANGRRIEGATTAKELEVALSHIAPVAKQ